MTLGGLTLIVVLNGVVQLAGLVLLGVFLIRGQQDIARMTRAVAGLVYQEEEKTRTLLKELLSPERGRA